MGFKKVIEACWYRNSPGILYPLYPLEAIFKAISGSRRSKFLKRLPKTAPNKPVNTIPVVVVGNLVVGGTGKTPLIIALVKLLQSCEVKVGVISRGYGRKAKSLHVLSRASSADLAGDEPLEIFEACDIPVVVHSDRNFALQVLQNNFDVEIVLSDDGLQHYGLNRDIEIAVFNQFHGCGNGHSLPLGPLREPVKRLEAVDFVLFNQANVKHASLRNLQHKQQSVFRIEPVCWVNVQSGATLELSELRAGNDKNRAKNASGDTKDIAKGHTKDKAKNNKLCAMAAIGQPKKFFASLEQLNLSFDTVVKADHARFTENDFKTTKYQAFVMTAKDAVKCRNVAPANAWYLRIQAKLSPVFQEAFLDKVEVLLEG